MKQVLMVSTDTLAKIINIFGSNEEYSEFILHLMQVSNEIGFSSGVYVRCTSDEAALALAKIMVIFSGFCRQNFDVIQQLVRVINFETKDIPDGLDGGVI